MSVFCVICAFFAPRLRTSLRSKNPGWPDDVSCNTVVPPSKIVRYLPFALLVISHVLEISIELLACISPAGMSTVRNVVCSPEPVTERTTGFP